MDFKDIQIAEGVRALDRGWKLISLRGKKPAFEGGGAWKRCLVADEAAIRAAIQQGFNLGVLCKESGIVVVDIDLYKKGVERLPDHVPTLTAETGRGGLHLYYEDPGVPLLGLDGLGVDIKLNGYVVLPPGFSGHQYQWSNELSIAKLPSSAVERMRKPSPGERVPGQDEDHVETRTVPTGVRHANDRSRRDFKLARGMIEMGRTRDEFIRELRSLPPSQDKGRGNPSYYDRTWQRALAVEPTPPNTPVVDMCAISHLPWSATRDKRQLKTDMAVAAWLVYKARLLEREMFRVAVTEIARGTGRGRASIGKSLHRLHRDGFIDFVNPHNYDVERKTGRPRQIDVAPLIDGNLLRPITAARPARRKPLDQVAKRWKPNRP
jgi:hypothetical protein